MPESPANPDKVQTREDLGRELSLLRKSARLTVRDLASSIGAPAATVGDYFSGRHLPGPRQLPIFLSILGACGVEDSAEVERWQDALGRARFSTDGRAPKGPSPYRGLEALGEDDADLFFGRRRALDELLSCVRSAVVDAPHGAVALVGPSGSGKTSLLLAGLLPALRADGDGDWNVVAITPDRLVALSENFLRAGARNVVIVDQVESVLALSPEERSKAMARLARWQELALVIFGLRADFYQAALAEPSLLPGLRHQVLLGPMIEVELREAIGGPIRKVGGAVEDALVDLILAELAPGSPAGFAHGPGALPLLSYALLATWNRSVRNSLTVADYQAVGGLRGSVRQAAEEVYDGLDSPQRDQARRMFARLIRVEDDGQPTRRLVLRHELEGANDGVLEQFIAARLVTADEPSVQISHEALLGAWPRLNSWVQSDREWLRLHQQLGDAARTWNQSGQDETQLWSGTRLDRVLEAAEAQNRDQDLNDVETRFLSASTDRKQAHEQGRRRRARRMRVLLAALAILTAAAVVLAIVAVNADFNAEQARDQALSRQVALEATQLQPTDPSLAAQLAVAAYRISPTVQARSALLDATAGELPTRLLGPIGPQAVSVSGNGQLLAVAQAATDSIALYQLSSSSPVKLVTVHAGPAGQDDYGVALSSDGQLLAAAGTAGTLTLWDVSNPATPKKLATLTGVPNEIYALAFAPNGQSVAGADGNGTVVRWNVSNPTQPSAETPLKVPGGAAVRALSYSADGSTIAACGDNGGLAAWKLHGLSLIQAVGTDGSACQGVAFSPDGTRIATGSGNNDTIQTWKIVGATLRPAIAPIVAATSEIDSIGYSPDGSQLAVSSADGSIHLYNTATWKRTSSFADTYPVTSLTFAPDGKDLITASSGGVTRIWPLPVPSSYTQPGNVYSVNYTANNAYIASASSGPTGGVTIWKNSDLLRPTRLVDVSLPSSLGAAAGDVAVNPAGTLLATENANAQVQLFSLADINHPVPVGGLLTGNKPYIEQLSFNPAGNLLIASDDTGQLRIWNVANPSKPVPMPTLQSGNGEVLGFGITPNGGLLATASSDNHVRLYNFSNPAQPKLLATLGGFASYAYDATITPDGRTLIAGSADGTIRMWDISDPSHPRLLGKPLVLPTGEVFQVTVSPGGKTLAAASTTAAVWLWNIANPSSPQLQGTLGAAQDEVFTVRFSPNGQVLAAGGSDNMVHFWDADPASAENLICSSTGDAITQAEWSKYIQGARYAPPCPGAG